MRPRPRDNKHPGAAPKGSIQRDLLVSSDDDSAADVLT
jgi:hypothetical protein